MSNGRLRHSVTCALIRMVKIGRVQIEEEDMYVHVFIGSMRINDIRMAHPLGGVCQ